MARILVIEDNAANLELMVYLLRAYGHAVIAAEDGETGLEVAARERPDVILCDVQLPVIDGCEVARRLKTNPELRVAPRVAVTAMAMVGDRDKLLASGFDGYIGKPIRPETFVREVEAFLVKNGAALRIPEPAPYPDPVASGGQSPFSPDATILVVDDTPANNELSRCILEPAGYRVIIAPGAAEALRIAREIKPDLILSDVDMPGKDGYDLFRELQDDPQLSAIPFVFISSTSRVMREGPLPRAELANVKFIVRPIEASALLAEIETSWRKPDDSRARPKCR